ncbi:MAG: hypothetical protein HWD85_08565 [Flavobacteriaceae bacterium]|nr:hypothetical protein [Flavobacteriaceae bacterium]
MRIALTILIGIHAIIHLFGFLKAFELSDFNAINQPISKTFGIVWLLTFILFSITTTLLVFHSSYWWISGFLAAIVSQVLIFNYWSDAKFGTIINLIIFVAVIVAYSNFDFKNRINKEREILLKNSQFVKEEVITKESILRLPIAVQKWLNNIGVIGKTPISNVYLTQELQLKLDPNQENWNTGKAEQYFTVNPPAFNWSINTKTNAILSVVGRDKFENGNGEMKIKLLSLIPIVDVKNNNKINQASLQRFLAEIIWFPTAALNKNITWEHVNENSAKATIKVNETIGFGTFHFDSNGNFQMFTALRYKDINDTKPKLWTVSAIKTEKMNGVKVPVECKASWKLESGKWTWLKLKIKELKYNLVTTN